jgi:hypothetical protein
VDELRLEIERLKNALWKSQQAEKSYGDIADEAASALIRSEEAEAELRRSLDLLRAKYEALRAQLSFARRVARKNPELKVPFEDLLEEP